MINKYAVKKLSEYIDLVTKINVEESENAWFRGHSSASHRLVPGVLRNTVPLRSAYGHELTGNEILRASGNTVTGLNSERMLDEFKRKSRPFLDHEPKNDFEWLFLMQHYGVPTRLLDWTTNALVALFFAVEGLNLKNHKSKRNSAKLFLEGDEHRDDGVAVFIINPSKINKASIGVDYPIDISQDYESWSHYSRPMEAEASTYSPISILAPHSSPRIRAQSGTFTLHGSNIWALDFYEVLRPLISKIFIPYNEANKIRDQLSILGITRSFVFPGLDGICEEIKQLEMRRYAIEINQYMANKSVN